MTRVPVAGRQRRCIDELVELSGDLDRVLARMERRDRLQRDHDQDVDEVERIAGAMRAAVRGRAA